MRRVSEEGPEVSQVLSEEILCLGRYLIYDVSAINRLRSAPVPSISGSGIYSLVGLEEIRQYRVRGYRKLTTRPGTDILEMMLLADAICIGLVSRTVQMYSHEPC